MPSETDYLQRFRVQPGKRVHLDAFDPDWTDLPELQGLDKPDRKTQAEALLAGTVEQLQKAQELLWAADTRAVLVVLQAMDAAGKDSAIKHVMSGVNPQGCVVHSFKVPSAEELDHSFLWRCMKAVPSRGQIAIFNRSHYEDVLVVRVHPEYLERAKLPEGKRGKTFWKTRYRDINAFERHLDASGTTVLKFFLHVSPNEQKKRFIERIDQPEKNWKFSLADVEERALWPRYMRAYERALTATSTPWAPWYVIPADHKWVTRLLVARVLVGAIDAMQLRYPQVSEEHRAAMVEARRRLEAE